MKAKFINNYFHIYFNIIMITWLICIGLQKVKNTTLTRELEVMGEPIEWAPDLLLKADGFESSYYMKD